jgi:hypothetical protein
MHPAFGTGTAPVDTCTPPSDLPFEDIELQTFTNPTRIDNPWLPLHPGKQLVFEGQTEEGDEIIPHRVLFTATDLTKILAGIRVFVSYELDYSAGELVEAELVFFAQDDDGIVWHVGQYPESYEGGALVEPIPTWIHGLADARAGIIMQAVPTVDAEYRQGYSPNPEPDLEYTDWARIEKLDDTVTVPFGTYNDVLVIQESSASEENACQIKSYARGVGNIHVGSRGVGATRETLELKNVVELDDAALADIRNQALALEASAYAHSPKVYAYTAAAERATAML